MYKQKTICRFALYLKINNMINLENCDFDEDTKEVRADFGGFLEDGFYVTTNIDYDIEVAPKEEEVGIMKDIKTVENFTFWHFQMFNSANERISFSEREVREIKHEIESHVTNKLED